MIGEKYSLNQGCKAEQAEQEAASAMITIHEDRKEKIVKLMHSGNELNALRLYSLEEVLEAHDLLTQYLAQKHKGLEFIGSAQAQAIAAAEGYDIPISTLVNACSRDTIPGAHKRRGRWLFPKANFETWYNEWKAKQAADVQN